MADWFQRLRRTGPVFSFGSYSTIPAYGVVRLAERTLAHRYPHGEWWHLNAPILDAIRGTNRQPDLVQPESWNAHVISANAGNASLNQ